MPFAGELIYNPIAQKADDTGILADGIHSLKSTDGKPSGNLFGLLGEKVAKTLLANSEKTYVRLVSPEIKQPTDIPFCHVIHGRDNPG